MKSGRMGSKQGDGEHDEAGEAELGGRKAYGVEAVQLDFGQNGGDGVAEGREGDDDRSAEEASGSVVNSWVAGVGDDDEQHAGEGEKDAGDGEKRGAGTVDGHGQNQCPDGRGCVEHSGDVAWHGAFAPGEEGEGDDVHEQSDEQEPEQQTPWGQLMAAKTKDGPEKGSA